MVEVVGVTVTAPAPVAAPRLIVKEGDQGQAPALNNVTAVDVALLKSLKCVSSELAVLFPQATV
jgi:hypothetical protein